MLIVATCGNADRHIFLIFIGYNTRMLAFLSAQFANLNDFAKGLIHVGTVVVHHTLIEFLCLVVLMALKKVFSLLECHHAVVAILLLAFHHLLLGIGVRRVERQEVVIAFSRLSVILQANKQFCLVSERNERIDKSKIGIIFCRINFGTFSSRFELQTSLRIVHVLNLVQSLVAMFLITSCIHKTVWVLDNQSNDSLGLNVQRNIQRLITWREDAEDTASVTTTCREIDVINGV